MLARVTQPAISAGSAIGDREERIPEAVGGNVEQAHAVRLAHHHPPGAGEVLLDFLDPGHALAEPFLEEALVDVGQRLEVGERDALVDHVHGLADQSELHDRAVILDEARIGGAAGGRQLRRPAGHGLDRPPERLDQLVVARQEDVARPVAPDELEVDGLLAALAVGLPARRAVEPVVDFGLERLGRPAVVEADVEGEASPAPG